MLFFLSLFFFSQTLSNDAYILHCDFEHPCNDFLVDMNWGLTDGNHSEGIGHDHTLNSSAGHYLFYNPLDTSRFSLAEIESSGWIEPSTTNQPLCFRMWYYSSFYAFPFNVQLVQGDDEQLTRIAASIPDKQFSVKDWTLINITLPNEKIKIVIRVNVTYKPLVFDDFSVDYCNGSQPLPPKILFDCDFESSCSDSFTSLPLYPYQWFILNANDAMQMDKRAPAVDYTYGNSSGHYAVVPNGDIYGAGKVGYLHLEKEFQITANTSYCLNFQYYTQSQTGGPTHLYIYSYTTDQPKTIQLLWPVANAYQYGYVSGNWTWGIVNLPVGNYSLLFRADIGDGYVPRLFALDNISIISCAYPPYDLNPDDSLLSFSCNFDDLTMCDMINEHEWYANATYNFTVFTGNTVPNKDLGPTRDHTTNSSTGGFLYWNQQATYRPTDSGYVYTPQPIEQNAGMCVKFAYYVKSAATNKNGTVLGMTTGGCYGATLWYISLDDSQGWQTVLLNVSNYACGETFYFSINQRALTAVSVAFDDIQVDQCISLIPTTTTSTTMTSTTTTTTTTSTTTTTKTTTTALTSSSTTMDTSSAITTTITTTTTTSITTPASNARQLLTFNMYTLIIFSVSFSLNILNN